jgi:magnesium chelatase family protein
MIHSVSGLLPGSCGLRRISPFRTPHHTASDIALVGGGKIPGAGEVSLAHNGVLFMDEFSEFKSNVLQSLRQPLEDQMVTVSRASGTATFPSDFLLIAATNPCPCGYLFDPEKQCRCTSHSIAAYFRKIAGPVLDRIDMEVYVPRVAYRELMNDTLNESSVQVRGRVEAARRIQLNRFAGRSAGCNARMSSRDVKQFCAVDESAREYLEHAAGTLGLSARSFFRILKVARTIADLAGKERIEKAEIAEALSYKSLNRLYGS